MAPPEGLSLTRKATATGPLENKRQKYSIDARPQGVAVVPLGSQNGTHFTVDQFND